MNKKDGSVNKKLQLDGTLLGDINRALKSNTQTYSHSYKYETNDLQKKYMSSGNGVSRSGCDKGNHLSTMIVSDTEANFATDTCVKSLLFMIVTQVEFFFLKAPTVLLQ